MTTNNKKNLFTVFFSIFITLFLIEIFFKFIVYKDLEKLKNNPEITIKSGMQASVSIIGEERTVLSYLFNPITKLSKTALRE